jgi:hypothetical protein
VRGRELGTSRRNPSRTSKARGGPLRKVRAGDYHSECFAWDVEDEVESDAKVPEVEDEVAAESENSEDSEDSECKRGCVFFRFLQGPGFSQ